MTPDELKDFRTGLGWSQADLAERMGISQSQVSRIEDGKSAISKPLQIVLSHIVADLEQEPAA